MARRRRSRGGRPGGAGGVPAAARQARVQRRTRETEVLVQLAVDGTGQTAIETPIPFFNHMLEAMGRHGLLDLTIHARGDTEVDLHHTVEDVGICLGRAFLEALGERRGIVRFGTAWVPMDEALASVHVDISGRPYLSFNVPLTKTRVGTFDLDLLQDFFRAFASHAQVNVHVNLQYGENLHHIAEAIFKAFGRALGEAARLDPRVRGVPSTKGVL